MYTFVSLWINVLIAFGTTVVLVTYYLSINILKASMTGSGSDLNSNRSPPEQYADALELGKKKDFVYVSRKLVCVTGQQVHVCYITYISQVSNHSNPA